MFKIILFLYLFLFFSENVFAKQFATLRAIDRTTGRSYKLNIPLNKEVIFLVSKPNSIPKNVVCAVELLELVMVVIHKKV